MSDDQISFEEKKTKHGKDLGCGLIALMGGVLGVLLINRKEAFGSGLPEQIWKTGCRGGYQWEAL
jgi:hypothetical protein